MQIYLDILPQKEFEDLHTVFFKFIQAGLSDNFTEVRFAATKTVFQFLAKIMLFINWFTVSFYPFFELTKFPTFGTLSKARLNRFL